MLLIAGILSKVTTKLFRFNKTNRLIKKNVTEIIWDFGLVCDPLRPRESQKNKHCEVLVSYSGQKIQKYSNLNLRNLQEPSETFRNL